MSTTEKESKKTFTFWDLEAQIFDLERVRVVFRVDPAVRVKGLSYNDLFVNATARNKNLTTLRKRIAKLISQLTNDVKRGGLKDVDPTAVHFHFIDGYGNYPNQLTHVETVRLSYEKV